MADSWKVGQSNWLCMFHIHGETEVASHLCQATAWWPCMVDRRALYGRPRDDG